MTTETTPIEESVPLTLNQQAQLVLLNEFAEKFMFMKRHFIGLNLPNIENVRLAVQYFDDGFLRAREAIFATEVMLPDANDAGIVTTPEDKPTVQ